MIRVVGPLLLIGFIGLLGFIYLMVQTRRDIDTNELDKLQAETVEYEKLLQNIRVIAHGARDVDPSAELILMTIHDFNRKEIQQ